MKNGAATKKFMLWSLIAMASIVSIFRAETLRAASTWEINALRLSGESDTVARLSVRKLRATPHLEAELRQALGERSTRYFLALDVISTLKLKALLPDLINISAQDPSGFAYLSLNAFFDAGKANYLAELYKDRLVSPASSTPAKMVLIDTLGRLQVFIDAEELRKLLNDSSEPELRSAALYYVRSFLRRGDARYRGLFNDLRARHERGRGQENSSFQMQIQFLSRELGFHD